MDESIKNLLSGDIPISDAQNLLLLLAQQTTNPSIITSDLISVSDYFYLSKEWICWNSFFYLDDQYCFKNASDGCIKGCATYYKFDTKWWVLVILLAHSFLSENV